MQVRIKKNYTGKFPILLLTAFTVNLRKYLLFFFNIFI